MPVRRAAVLGLGLIGGSIGLALRAAGCHDVAGWDISPEAAAQAAARGCADVTAAASDAVRGAEMVFIATPPSAVIAVLGSAAPGLAPDAIVTDAAGVKGAVCAEGEARLGGRFVGGHPMAGGTVSGSAAARADVFAGAPWLLCRTGEPDLAAGAPARVAEVVRAFGAEPVAMAAAAHDRLVALASHAPHLISFGAAHALAHGADGAAARAIGGGSLADLLRVAASSPELWADVLSENRAEALRALDEITRGIEALRGPLERGDRAALLAALTEAARYARG